MVNNYIKGVCVSFLLAFFLSVAFVSADANWEVTLFSCTPEDLALGSDFSCTATVENTGDATGTLGTATLYSDASNWLEKASYVVASNTELEVGEQAEITFTGLRAGLSGVNGFSKVMLDSITDTAGVEDVTVNTINVVVSVSSSASSVTSGTYITATADVVAGGNINVDLTFTGPSGCAITN